MTAMSTDPVLVTSSTGRQGGATVRALLARGTPDVRAMVRDPQAPSAQALAAAGAQLVVGDFEDPASLRAACAGARAVFSMQSPIMSPTGVDFTKERPWADNLVAAALAVGVPTFVHSSTSGVGEHRRAPGWKEGKYAAQSDYYENKLYAIELVRNAGFESFTIIFPSTFMSHPMIDPRTFADGRRLVTVIRPDHKIPLIDTTDIGIASAAAMNDPATFNGVDLHLAGDLLTLPEVVEILSGLDGKDYVVESGSPEEAAANGLNRSIAEAMTFVNVLEVPATPAIARSYGLAPIDFETWARRQRGLA
jgi:uncharacterized protein YbjT (DUF2867 family)